MNGQKFIATIMTALILVSGVAIAEDQTGAFGKIQSSIEGMKKGMEEAEVANAIVPETEDNTANGIDVELMSKTSTELISEEAPAETQTLARETETTKSSESEEKVEGKTEEELLAEARINELIKKGVKEGIADYLQAHFPGMTTEEIYEQFVSTNRKVEEFLTVDLETYQLNSSEYINYAQPEFSYIPFTGMD